MTISEIKKQNAELQHALRMCIECLIVLGQPRQNYSQWSAVMADALGLDQFKDEEVLEWGRRHQKYLEMSRTKEEGCDDVFQQALKEYGHNTQYVITIGEIGEFLQLFGKEAQGRVSKEEWIDEIADVMVMMRQMALIHGIDDVEQRFHEKVMRLKHRIATGYYNNHSSDSDAEYCRCQNSLPAGATYCATCGKPYERS